ncbi:NAD(P) binding enzyme [Bacillus tequilensis]|nr:NAD(P) binding enzyme [Bacillus tequilensis]
MLWKNATRGAADAMESTLIVGADEFFGLSLCERMMEEGIHVDVILAETEDETRQMYLEERLMWLGRNELFRQLEHIEEQKYDTICIQFGGFLPVDQFDSPYILVYEQDRKEWEKREKPGSETTVILPKMYGPWKEETEEEGYYTGDVADELLRFLLEPSRTGKNQFFDLPVTEKTTKEEAKTKISEWKRQFSSIFDKY